MNENPILAQLPDILLPWYHGHKRELPWRADADPYHIWVSEIMLQQTRVEAVKDYYNRFIKALPTVRDLANADDDLLHKLWEGLGYYTRVRNMKKAALQILEHHNGIFPKEYADVISLPGIGEYTAGAICSIAFAQKTPAVDGNVLRVVARLLNDASPIDAPAFKRSIRDALASVYPAEAGAFTQALMELGATVCGPNRKPDCGACPCSGICRAFSCGTAEQLPVKNPKKAKRVEERTVFILSCDGQYAIEKRPEEGLLAGIWQFPNITGKAALTDALAAVEHYGLKPKEIYKTVERKHIFTHIIWNMTGIYMEVSNKNDVFTWKSSEKIDQEIALPTAFRQFWKLAQSR